MGWSLVNWVKTNVKIIEGQADRLEDTTKANLTMAVNAVNKDPIAALQVAGGVALIATGAGAVAGASLIAKGGLTLAADMLEAKALDDASKATPETVPVMAAFNTQAQLAHVPLPPELRTAAIQHAVKGTQLTQATIVHPKNLLHEIWLALEDLLGFNK